MTGFRTKEGAPIICPNEQKLLFKPYTREELVSVLQGLALEALSPFGLKVDDVVNQLAF